MSVSEVMGRHRNLAMLIGLSLLWGASFLFIKVAVRELTPATLITGRLGLAALTLALLVPFAVGTGATAQQVRGYWPWLVVVALVNTAIPFWLLSWGETRIDSGLASIIQASVPIFNALLILRFLPHERLTRTQALGLAIGLAGVAVVTGIHPEGGTMAMVGAFAVVLSSLSYAAGGVYGQRAVSGTSGPVLAAGSMLVAGLILLPFALFQLPTSVPSAEAIASLLALSLLGTALAQLILFRMLALHGSARLSLVTYLMPGIALVYGALLLDEAITPATIGGLVLILGGVALASGSARLSRREAAAART